MYLPTLLTLAKSLALAFVLALAIADESTNPELVAKLRAAGTQVDRLKLLPNDTTDWTFDFTTQPGYTFQPASVISANVASFPTVVGNKLTMGMIQLGPCGMLPPHYHPRASNYVLAVQGETHTYAVEENGARVMATVLTPGKMTIFPQAAIHTMMNQACEPAQLVTALSDEDQGTTNLLNNLFQLPPEFVGAAFGDAGLDVNGTAAKIPPVGNNGVPGSAACRKRCNMTA